MAKKVTKPEDSLFGALGLEEPTTTYKPKARPSAMGRRSEPDKPPDATKMPRPGKDARPAPQARRTALSRPKSGGVRTQLKGMDLGLRPPVKKQATPRAKSAPDYDPNEPAGRELTFMLPLTRGSDAGKTAELWLSTDPEWTDSLLLLWDSNNTEPTFLGEVAPPAKALQSVAEFDKWARAYIDQRS